MAPASPPSGSEPPGWHAMRQVLGDAYVERSLAADDPLVMQFRDAAVEICWTQAWSRPGLDLPTRSLLTIGLLIALGKPSEVELHVRGAVRQGIEPARILEVVIHCAAYCGVPAGLDGLRAMLRGLQPADRAKEAR